MPRKEIQINHVEPFSKTLRSLAEKEILIDMTDPKAIFISKIRKSHGPSADGRWRVSNKRMYKAWFTFDSRLELRNIFLNLR